MGKVVDAVSDVAGGILNPALGLATGTLSKFAGKKAAGGLVGQAASKLIKPESNPQLMAQTMYQAARTPLAARLMAAQDGTPSTWLTGPRGGQTLGDVLRGVSLFGAVR